MSKQDLQLLNIEVDTFKWANNQSVLDVERKLFRYDRINELDELKHGDLDFLWLTSLVERNHHVILAYLLPDKVKNLKALSKEDKAGLDTTEDTKIVAYRYIPVSNINQTSSKPVLTTRDFIKDHLTINRENVTALYNEFKDYLNKNTDLRVSEKPLARPDGVKGCLKKGTNETVIGGDEPDS